MSTDKPIDRQRLEEATRSRRAEVEALLTARTVTVRGQPIAVLGSGDRDLLAALLGVADEISADDRQLREALASSADQATIEGS